MLRTLILTKDGSHTVAVPEMDITFHSMHGAIQESLHVFIRAGLDAILQTHQSPTISIFEMGFGTGLNALLTLIEAEKKQQPIHYTAIELFPLEHEHIQSLNYCTQLNREDLQPVFEQMHQPDWEKEISLSPFFTLRKSVTSLLDLPTAAFPSFNLVYFDAFAPTVQPEVWTNEVFEKLYAMLATGGLLVTYCSKSDVRRAMQAGGFVVKKIPGPWGKREMVRAEKI